MSRINYREIVDRFTHIDAQFVRARCQLGDNRAEYVVRFYPWWEHPRYLEAVESGGPWGFSDMETGTKEVVVHAVAPFEFRLSDRSDVVDWSFSSEHPALWAYADKGQIFVNEDFDKRALFQQLLDRRNPFVDSETLSTYLDVTISCSAPYSLGYFPSPLFEQVRGILTTMNVPLFIPGEPEVRDLGVAFVIDEDDYILASDFESDVPKFEHREEYFDPRLDPR